MFKNLFKWNKKGNGKKDDDLELNKNQDMPEEKMEDEEGTILEDKVEVEIEDVEETLDDVEEEQSESKHKLGFEKLMQGLDKTRKEMTDKIDSILKILYQN